MKKKLILSFAFLSIFSTVCFVQSGQAQFLKRLKQKIAQTAGDHVTNDAGNATDKTIDKTESSAGNAVKGNNNGNNSSSNNNNSGSNISSTQSSATEATPTIAVYKNYDFVPGDTIIFQSQLADEQVGEIPSQLTVSDGQTDIQQINGENVIHIPKGAGATFTPRMTNRNYMPDQFTVEFDYLNEISPVNHLTMKFGGNDNDDQDLGFWGGNIAWIGNEVGLPDALKIDPMQWQHIAFAVNKNAGKVYINQFRVFNTNNLAGKADNVSFAVSGYEDSYIKNP